MKIRFLLMLVFLLTTAERSAAQEIFDRLPDCGFSALAGANVEIGAVVFNFETNEGCVENLDQSFQTASVPKIFVAGTYYEMLATGSASPTTPLLFNEDYWMAGPFDCLRQEQLGSTYTTRELTEMMLWCSDNAATWMLMDAFGWRRVQSYIDSLGIAGIGPVIPYSEVDRRKLAYLDETWARVPRALASRFLRSRLTAGLVPAYFSSIPELQGSDLRRANTWYLAESEANTLTPRAMAEYLLNLRRAMVQGSTTEAIVARYLFDAMLYTQRLNSAQALPGSVLVAGKNGFDGGVLAEVNVIFHDANASMPGAIALIFANQSNLEVADVQFNSIRRSVLNDTFQRLSPRINALLYPSDSTPPVNLGTRLTTALFQRQSNIEPCWGPYRFNNFDPARLSTLESCWQQVGTRSNYTVGENLGAGLVFREMREGRNWITLVYTAPGGRRYSYQTDRHFQTSAGIYWFHPLEQAGEWTVDVYLNLERVYTQRVRAGTG